MKFALGQINPTIGDVTGNTEKIRSCIERAAACGARLVVFPELALTGYPPQDLLDSPALVEKNLFALEQLAACAPQVAVVVGFVDRNPSPVGRPFFNAAALLREGKIEAVYHKILLPSYDVFDDERYFESGKQPFVFELEGLRFTVTICEDLWPNDFLPRHYTANPLQSIRELRCDWVVNLSASPFSSGKPEIRQAVFERAIASTGASLIFCNQVGANDDLIFDGGSAVVEKQGLHATYAASFAEDLLVWEASDLKRASLAKPAPVEEISSALVLGIRDYVAKTHGAGVCLGLSGGIDSSVVAALAVKALGADRVRGILLPTRFTSAASNEDALGLAAHLKIRTTTLPIDALYESTSKLLKDGLGSALASLTLENIQPRLRMVLLMAVANEENLLLLNTSNKSELAAGYATLYGDSAGALAVLGDVTKDRVYALAEFLNRGGAGIPRRAIDRAPSAELKEGQKDEDSLPPYPVLDRMVGSVVERSAQQADLIAGGASADQAQKFLKLYRQSEYKRRQFPPILRISSRAFGRGRKIPVASFKPW